MSAPWKILVVEDENIVAMDLRTSLTGSGYEVTDTVGTAREAIDSAQRRKPDLVLMDIRLRGEMDGVAAADVMRTQLALPVVYLTAFSDEPTLRRARVTEPFGYLLKPFDERELNIAIELAIYRHQAQREHENFLREQAARAAVEERALENARLYQAAREAVAVRDEFLSVASHELRTPLTAMLLTVQGLERVVQRSQDERLRERTARVAQQLGRLIKLVDSLLDVSRIKAGRIELSPEEFDLSALATEVAARFIEPARENGSTLVVRAPDRLVGVWDPLRVDQVLTNLLSNAVKFGAGKPIELALQGDDAAVRLVVADRGIGISKDKIASVFERFERAVPVRKYGGLGLGLYIARQLVEAHGGRIEVQSEPGQGSTFIVQLPRWRPDSAAS